MHLNMHFTQAIVKSNASLAIYTNIFVFITVGLVPKPTCSVLQEQEADSRDWREGKEGNSTQILSC